MKIFQKYPQIYSVLIPAISVPIMLFVTFILMGIEVRYNGGIWKFNTLYTLWKKGFKDVEEVIKHIKSGCKEWVKRSVWQKWIKVKIR